jgi:hypothetical protein
MMYAGLLTRRSKLISDKTMVIGRKVSNFAAIFTRTFKTEIKMKKAKIGMLAIVCMIAASCGNMNQVLSAIQNGSVINAITSVIGLDKVSAQNLIGTWTYNGPGCAFTSENLLAKAGGEVAAAQIEEKVKPYYQQVGISASNTQITFNQDGTFSSKIAGTNFSGTYTFNEASQQIKLKGLLLSINCYTKREINGISILFEAKKLLTVLQTMSALSGNANLQTIGDLSKQYDGVRVGFDMKR